EGKTGKGKGVPPLQKLICLYFTYLKGEGEGEGEGKTGKGKGVPPLQKLICLYFTYLKSAVYELQAVVF
ncbi:hypothetical protein QT999_27670, partial [Microcoleus sp. S36b_A2]|uniref:hypothetical protein n=1 Tax=unclassified Microcoleus TaxID=2642155 RepID=UPI002FD55BF2